MTKGINESVNQNTAKYHIYATFTINGVVEVQDVIGALFGQTEGLLNDLDLRELQKSGRIGRIVVNAHSENGITSGEIIIPSSLDRTETAILAATLETVDRVGPCNASLRLKEIRDLRASKLKAIEERAKELLKDWSQGANDKEDLAEKIQGELEKAQVVMWNGLPAGSDIEKAEYVIIVEGRNDVQQLFKIGVKNTVAVNGTSIPKAIIDLTHSKECVAFVDGDRGGEMILNELVQVSNVKSFARAPPNREVEELSPKELVKCLQQRLPIEEYVKQRKQQEEKDKQDRETKDRTRQEHARPEREPQGRDQRGGRGGPRGQDRRSGPPQSQERGQNEAKKRGPPNRGPPGRGGPRGGPVMREIDVIKKAVTATGNSIIVPKCKFLRN